MRAGNEDARVGPEIEYGEVGLVEFVDHGLHLGMDGRIAREVGGEPVAKLHHEAGGGAVFELGAVGVQRILLWFREQGGRSVVYVRSVDDGDLHALRRALGLRRENAAHVDARTARCCDRHGDRQIGAEVHRLAAATTTAATNCLHLVVNEAGHGAGRHQRRVLRSDYLDGGGIRRGHSGRVRASAFTYRLQLEVADVIAVHVREQHKVDSAQPRIIAAGQVVRRVVEDAHTGRILEDHRAVVRAQLAGVGTYRRDLHVLSVRRKCGE